MATVQVFYPFGPLKHLTSSSSSSSSSSSVLAKIQFSVSSSDSPPPASKSRRPTAVSVSFNPYGNLDLSLDDNEEEEAAPPPMPPTQGRFEIVIDNDAIARLDLTPFHQAMGITTPKSHNPKEFLERTVGFTINYVREDERDPRELSEFPDIRLWFVRLDAVYPWLPAVLDWRSGELARYAVMLVPHQMSMKKGVVFNPEALELFVVKKVFVVYSWLKENDVSMPRIKAKDMARMLGFGIGDDLFDLVDKQQ